MAAFFGNMRQGLRIACLRAPHADALHFSWGQLLALAALNLALGFIAQVAYVGLEGRFQADALPEALFLAPEFLLAWLLGVIACNAPGASVGRYLIALFALAIPVNIANGLLFLAYPHLMSLSNAWLQWGLSYLPWLWYIVAALCAAVRLFSLHGVRALVATATVLMLLLGLPFITDGNQWMWVAQSEPEDTAPRRDYFAAVREDAFYHQPQLLADALAELKPGRPGQVDVYFVGAAGYAPQDVFMKEVNSITQLFEQRFDTEGRSLKLINNEATLDDVPLASKTALQRALARIGELMNPDEDILFLYMTSHGSREHKFSLDFGAMRFNDIDPPTLRKLLDDSAIKHRVIVISACYSGGFIDGLKDDNNLVITAAAADKNSFGCDNESDFTYFGKAYFDEALRKTWSFTEAFEIAKPMIAAREKEQDYTPSEPQMALGKNIAPVLEALVKERQQTAVTQKN
jgi:hypothetical protein